MNKDASRSLYELDRQLRKAEGMETPAADAGCRISAAGFAIAAAIYHLAKVLEQRLGS